MVVEGMERGSGRVLATLVDITRVGEAGLHLGGEERDESLGLGPRDEGTMLGVVERLV